MGSYLGTGKSKNSRRPKQSLGRSKDAKDSKHPTQSNHIEITEEDKKAYSEYIKTQYRKSPIAKVFTVVKVVIMLAIVLLLIKSIFF
ncbi:MAG: hypothetical protein KDC92_00915 [Bacteroidetes bacterium]|nr:hypothetical protein [Bacteroidota bacterium]